MVSLSHEVIVDLFNNRPSLGAELLAEALDVPIPPYDEARVISIDLTEIQPAEYRADLVTVLLRAGKPVRVNIVEVQLSRSDEKRFTWPAYLGVSRNKHRCPVDLLVVAPDPDVAEWCREPIEMGVPGFVLIPPVLGKQHIPVVTDPAEAERRPELAVLSAMAHGDETVAVDIAQAVIPAIKKLDDKRCTFYYDVIRNSINEAARLALESMMKGYEYQDPLVKKIYGQGRKEGLDEGRKAGLDEGMQSARASDVLMVLRVRGIAVTDDARQRILAEKDIQRLERWLEKAIVASSLTEVFAEPS